MPRHWSPGLPDVRVDHPISPLWAVPSKSPGPRKSQSASAISKPLFVFSRIDSLLTVSGVSSAVSRIPSTAKARPSAQELFWQDFDAHVARLKKAENKRVDPYFEFVRDTRQLIVTYKANTGNGMADIEKAKARIENELLAFRARLEPDTQKSLDHQLQASR